MPSAVQFSISQSKEIAANILGHTGQYDVLDRNYARTVESYDLTAMRLGELSANGNNDVSTVSHLFGSHHLLLMIRVH